MSLVVGDIKSWCKAVNYTHDKRKKIAIIITLAILAGALFMPAVAYGEVDMGWLNGFFGIITNAIQGIANFLSNAFSGLFNSLQSWLNPVIEWFGDKIHAIGQAIGSAVDSLTGTLQNMWTAIKQFISTIFKPILDLVYGILYFIAQIFVVIKLVIKLMAHIFLLFIAISMGFINTITSLANWSGGSEYFIIPDSYTQGFSFVMEFADSAGINLLAGIAAVGVWLITGYATIRLAGGNR